MACRFVLALALLTLPSTLHAAIWSAGPNDITFTKVSGADPTLAANQDQITADVAITRGDTQGIYNAITELGFNLEAGNVTVDNTSPEGTLWAFSGLNGNPTFAYGTGAALYGAGEPQFGALTFADWETAANGGNLNFPSNLVNHAAVVYLTHDNIYLDLQFISWDVGKSGQNGFSYTRAVAPATAPEAASLAVVAAGSLALLTRRLRHRR